ncbi:MAG TPA: hypothetical protein VFA89_18305 [Terriglobales bacterium]|nr:hypothetical protein [Terriglobales bacterium]
MKITLKLGATLTLLASLASLAMAQQQSRVLQEGGNWYQEVTGSLAPSKNLRIKVDVGSVKITGSGQKDITYVIRNRAYGASEEAARRLFETYKITSWVKGDTAWITGDWQGSRPRKFSGDFVINVPREMDWVKVETEGGSVVATNLAGRVDSQSGGGSIRLDDIGGTINAETGGGTIDVGSVGGELNLRTGGGSIAIHSAKGKINAESGGGSVVLTSGLQGAVLQTGGGSIKVNQCTGRVKASTGGGSIDLGDIDGPAEIETGGGSIHLSSAKGPVRAETGGGSIELYGVSSARAETGAGGIVAKFVSSTGERTDSVLETSAGDITVYLASDLPISVRATVDLANGHSIRSDFPDIHINSEGGEYGPKTLTAEGSLNGGGPVLKVRTTTGDIIFRRAGH